MNAIEMEPGNLYRVIFQQQSGNGRWYRKQMTAVYLGFSQERKEWQFSLRPLFGTLALSKRWNPIERIELVEKDIPHRYKEGVRDRGLARVLLAPVSLGPVEKKYRTCREEVVKEEFLRDLSTAELDRWLIAARKASATRWPYTGTNDRVRLIEAEYKRRGDLLPEDRDV